MRWNLRQILRSTAKSRSAGTEDSRFTLAAAEDPLRGFHGKKCKNVSGEAV